MMDLDDNDEDKAFIPDYKIHLIEPNKMQDEDFNKLSTSLRQILLTMKYLNNKEQLQDIVNKDNKFQHLSIDEASVIEVCGNIKLNVKKDEAEVNMCKAIQDMIDEATAKAAEATAKATVKAIIETTINNCKILNLDEEKLIELLKVNLKVDKDQAIKYLTDYRNQQENANE